MSLDNIYNFSEVIDKYTKIFNTNYWKMILNYPDKTWDWSG